MQPEPLEAPTEGTRSSIDPDRFSLVVALVTFVLVPMRMLSLGYMPTDDALRHAGKALTTRTWAEILVLRPEITMDSHPGWHFLLREFHQLTGAHAVDLVFLAVMTLFVLVCSVGLFSSPYPLGWLAALVFASIFDQSVVFRLFMGRPFLVSIAALVWILCLAERGRLVPSRLSAALWILGFGFVAWIHPSFYLFALPVAAFAICGQFEQAASLASVVFAGSLLAAIFSGEPMSFFEQAFLHPLVSLAQPAVTLVSEFQPSSGAPLFTLASACLLAGIWPPERRSLKGLLSDPVVVLVTLCWVLGRTNQRFWADWGAPALLVLLSREIGRSMARSLPSGRARLGATLFLATVLGVSLCHDGGGRFSRPDSIYLPLLRPEAASVLPDPGGILYSDNMLVFYNVFMRQPDAPFRFVLGFEAGWMKPEDEAVYRNYLVTGVSTAFQPWVKKMRPEDRLIVGGSPQNDLPQLQWTKASAVLWSGRKLVPAEGAGSPDQKAPNAKPAGMGSGRPGPRPGGAMNGGRGQEP